ncbi:hypothetical protein TVAG_160270 [Trichomonas vaginalis G3]|uniref:Uncharacterized protein n=1 Tax=Trichomonas vaginalis (strain ATCC PRA-98 / G3) TaxID=412133 RepID=A2DUW9_TRIV3|nr:hypothetical protein TVAGG3_0259130 [Trichomonas vaginalis G3]EAY15854.1 hypothetical protein TVAG_160270 [Trichomonas vaginalis G3]KAI5524977.1 hypothetical protein TVAGG3_0259130 [Trichomonas vaginalis G3]|eukprot:XP_001328077.1 hypothetical protein [Trichomonas vaginalis G3]
MFSLLLLPLTRSLYGEIISKYDYQFFDESYSDDLGLIKKLYTKVRYDGSIKNIQDASDLDYMVNISHYHTDNYNVYFTVKQTITNKGTTEKKIDLCTAMVFNEMDKFVDSYTIPNFGWSLYFTETFYNTIVLQNHPMVTNVNAQDYGLDEEPRFFTNNLTALKMTVTDSRGINWLSFSWLNNYIKPGESVSFTYLYFDKEYEPPLLQLDKSLITEEVDSTEPIHLKGSYSHYSEGLMARAFYQIYDRRTYKLAKRGRIG